MNNQQAIDRLLKHLEWGWSEETAEAIKMGIHALKETQWMYPHFNGFCCFLRPAPFKMF